MAYVVRMPKLGVEMETGVVTVWHVGVEDPVEEEEVIAEIESEKSAAEVTARESGILRRIHMEEGDEGPPGAPMGIVAGPHEDVSDLEADLDVDATDEAPTEEESSAGDGAAGEGDATGAEGRGGDDGAPAGDGQSAEAAAGGTPTGDEPAEDGVAPRTPEGRIKATPKARKRAEERGVSLATLSGSGPEGAIVAADVEAAAEGTGGGPADTGAAGDRTVAGATTRTVREERPLTPMRSTIAERLGRSRREIPHVTVDREVEVEAAIAAAARADGAADVDVGVVDVVLAAVSATLSDHPAFNATYDAGAERHTLYEEHNVGVAVDVEGGLLTPVLADLRGRSPGEVAAARRRLVDRVLAGDHDPDDLSGGTFTVSNLGAFGSDSFTPIVDPPEVAILGMNRIRERPVDTDGGIEFRRHVTFGLSFDHRVVDGGDAARFLSTLDEHLADAGSLVADE